MLNVLHVGLGPLGQRVVSDLHERRLGRVVAAVDPAPGLRGRALAEIVHGPTSGIVLATVEEALDEVMDTATGTGADVAVVTTSSTLPRCAETFRALLHRGLTVVSSCEELAWPRLRHPALAEELHQIAVARGGRLLGAGVNPGLLMDALPAFATAPCAAVRSVHGWRIQDATPRRVPFQQKIGAGMEPEAFREKLRLGDMGHVGLPESLHFVASCAGFELEAWSEEAEPIVAERDLPWGLGTVRPGEVAGVRQVARGTVGGEVVVELTFRAALGQADPHDRVRVEGNPPIDLRIQGGVHGDVATSALVLNVVPSLLASAPGLHTMASIPLPRFHRTIG